MSMIPANQTCSWMVYNMAITNACNLTHEFLASERARIERAYEHGEPVWMIVDELKLVHRAKHVALRADRDASPLKLSKSFTRVS